MKKIIAILIASSFLMSLQAQTKTEKRAARKDKIAALIKQDEEGVMIYHKHNIGAISLTTDGYSAFLEKGIMQSKKKTTLYRIELAEKKHPKEQKLPSSQNAFGQSNSAIYAKLNNFYQFRLGYGIQYLIGSKGNKNGIEVTAVGVGGLSLGLQKPYFYDVVGEFDRSKRGRVTWDTKDTTAYNITGASGFSYGWNKVKINPGAFVRGGLRFDYGRFNETVSAVEVGLCTEFYSSKVPQLFAITQKQFFFSAYVALLFGKRK
jgi:hypothetical protein